MKKCLLLMLMVVSLVSMSCDDSNKPSFTRAAIISEEFVAPRMKFPAEVEFDGDRRGSETSANEYDVFQKFTAKNAFGVNVSYIYKIHMIYKSGDWTDKNSWTYNSLIIEDVSSGQQLDITHQKINNFVSGTLKSSAFLLPIQKLSLYLQCTSFETGDGHVRQPLPDWPFLWPFGNTYKYRPPCGWLNGLPACFR